VTGRLRQRSYETKEGDKRTVYELEADEVGVSLRSATAKVSKATRSSGSGSSAAQGAPGIDLGVMRHGDTDLAHGSDPWATGGAGGYSDQPPF
jgi:single-strand DNA-binding protein